MNEGETVSLMKLQEHFTATFEKAGGKVSVAKNEREVSQIILQICALEKARKLMLWNHPGLTSLGPLLSSDTRFQVNWNHDELNKMELLQAMEHVEVGITWTDFAVAETGSLVLLCSPGRSRSVSLLPDIHIAVLPLNQLYATRVEVFKRLTPLMKQSRAVTIISGPSKTGDIDGKLNVGVHGPKKIAVIILEEDNE